MPWPKQDLIRISIYIHFQIFLLIIKCRSTYSRTFHPDGHKLYWTLLYFNINSQLDATITNSIDNYNHLNMFRAIISPIFRSIRLFSACGIMHWRCCLLVTPHPCHKQAASLVYYTTSCKHNLVLLRMGEIIARNILSWLWLSIKYVIFYSS